MFDFHDETLSCLRNGEISSLIAPFSRPNKVLIWEIEHLMLSLNISQQDISIVRKAWVSYIDRFCSVMFFLLYIHRFAPIFLNRSSIKSILCLWVYILQYIKKYWLVNNTVTLQTLLNKISNIILIKFLNNANADFEKVYVPNINLNDLSTNSNVDSNFKSM